MRIRIQGPRWYPGHWQIQFGIYYHFREFRLRLGVVDVVLEFWR